MKDLERDEGLLQGQSDVLNRGRSGDDTSICILDQLEFME